MKTLLVILTFGLGIALGATVVIHAQEIVGFLDNIIHGLFRM